MRTEFHFFSHLVYIPGGRRVVFHFSISDLIKWLDYWNSQPLGRFRGYGYRVGMRCSRAIGINFALAERTERRLHHKQNVANFHIQWHFRHVCRLYYSRTPLQSSSRQLRWTLLRYFLSHNALSLNFALHRFRYSFILAIFRFHAHNKALFSRFCHLTSALDGRDGRKCSLEMLS